MMFLIRLRVPERPLSPVRAGRRYREKRDDTYSILMDICDALEKIDGVKFEVSICSTDLWPADVSADLCIVMGQLSDVLNSLHTTSTAQLGFYEQTLQRIVSFSKDQDSFVVECMHMIPSSDDPVKSMSVSRADVIGQLSRLGADFLRVARETCPKCTDHPWFKAWSESLEAAIALQ